MSETTLVPCEYCNATGQVHGGPCSGCKGVGHVTVGTDPSGKPQPCAMCSGTGLSSFGLGACGACRGAGWAGVVKTR